MEEIKYNKIALILLLVIGTFILVLPPFVVSIYIPFMVRFLFFIFIVSFSFLMILKKKKFVFYFLPFLVFFIVEFLYWLSIGANLGESLICLMCFSLAIVLLLFVRRIKSLKILLIKFYFFLVLILSVLSIISFLAFNLELAPYVLKPVGEGTDVYMYFHNYLLGYINPKLFESGIIGRVSGFMFEPSYQGWFLSTNFFLVSKFLKKKRYLNFIQLIVFLGALSSFSTMSWIVFSVVFTSILCFKLMSILRIKERSANVLYGLILLLSVFTLSTVVDQDELSEILGPSSADNRAERADVSFLYLVTASPKELVLGRGPGFIGANGDRGESNPIIKSLVENGILTTILVLIFIVYCTYKSKYFMIANLMWLNSVVVLFTPLFILNVFVCRWIDENAE